MARVLLIDGHEIETALVAARQARAAQRLVVLDGEILPLDDAARLLECVDVAIVDQGFGHRLWGLEPSRPLLERLRNHGPRLALVTLGADGALGLDDRGLFRLNGHPVAVRDTTGAGDLFHAGFVHGWLRGWPSRRAAGFANAFAALSVRRLGGRPGIPTEAEALSLLRQAEDGEPGGA